MSDLTGYAVPSFGSALGVSSVSAGSFRWLAFGLQPESTNVPCPSCLSTCHSATHPAGQLGEEEHGTALFGWPRARGPPSHSTVHGSCAASDKRSFRQTLMASRNALNLSLLCLPVRSPPLFPRSRGLRPSCLAWSCRCARGRSTFMLVRPGMHSTLILMSYRL